MVPFESKTFGPDRIGSMCFTNAPPNKLLPRSRALSKWRMARSTLRPSRYRRAVIWKFPIKTSLGRTIHQRPIREFIWVPSHEIFAALPVMEDPAPHLAGDDAVVRHH